MTLGWLGNIFLFIGLWNVGNKKRWAFLFTFVGELIWLVAALATPCAESSAWVAVCVVFAALALRNWYLWGKDQ